MVCVVSANQVYGQRIRVSRIEQPIKRSLVAEGASLLQLAGGRSEPRAAQQMRN
jgi:hypothetical protein